MNFDPKEFWKKALAKDEKGRPVNKKLYASAACIEREPLHGPGSRGGGRICVCDNCGVAEWTHTKTKQFCSRKCKYEFLANPNTQKSNLNAKRRARIHKNCSFCGKEFTLPASRLSEGQGIYCSTKCANRCRGFVPLWYICNTCGTHFRAVTDMGSRYCSKECAAAGVTNRQFSDGTYMEAIPRLVDMSDKVDHIINMNMESILRSLRKKIDIENITMNLKQRMKVIHKELNSNTDGYYLNKKERDIIRNMTADDTNEIYDE